MIKNKRNCQSLPFTTNSLDLAAFLLASGTEFLGCENTGGHRLAFLFPKDAEALVPRYYAGEQVSAIRFWAEVKRLKSIVWEQRKGI